LSASVAFDISAIAMTLVRKATDAIVYADAEGVIRFWNAAATHIFAIAPE
jgi:PAS domain-containing protein